MQQYNCTTENQRVIGRQLAKVISAEEIIMISGALKQVTTHTTTNGVVVGPTGSNFCDDHTSDEDQR